MCDQSKLLDAALSFVALIEITLKKEEREREREKNRKRKVSCVLVCLRLSHWFVAHTQRYIERMKVVIKKA